MDKDIVDSILEKGQKPISDGHDSQRIWDDGKYVLLYRKVFADKLGIKPEDIPEDMDVHHIDGDRMNNDIDNLMLCTRKAHDNLELMLDPHIYDPK